MKITEFRCWHVNHSTYAEPYKTRIKQMDYNPTFDDGCNSDYSCDVNNGFKDHNKIWMLYTTLHDKNGKKIYDSDIVNGACFNGSYAYGKVVYWKDGFFIEPIGKFVEGMAYLYDSLQHIEVIGNIYENQNLLK